eukprot:6086671-Prymnesium_polylepis.1
MLQATASLRVASAPFTKAAGTAACWPTKACSRLNVVGPSGAPTSKTASADALGGQAGSPRRGVG